MAPRKTALLGPNGRKVQPRLRMVANGSTVVNALRSEQCGSVRVTDQSVLDRVPTMRGNRDTPSQSRELPASVARGKLRRLPRDVEVSVFIHTTESNAARALPGQVARRANLVTATVPVSQLAALTRRPNVMHIELGGALATPTPVVEDTRPAAPSDGRWRFGSPNKHHTGRGVLTGIIDVHGFDFAHPEFLDDAGQTRFERIWDQGGTARPSPRHHQPFNYGAELRREHLNAAIAAAPSLGVPAQEIEPQSQMESGSHGTHVASIAAGRHGICREARLAAVLISLPSEDDERRKSFYDSVRIAHAVDT